MKNLIADLDHVIESLEDASGAKEMGLLNWDQIMRTNALRLRTIRKKLPGIIDSAPDKIQEALQHVHKHHPIVAQVFYGTDKRWLYCGENFEAPTFGKEIDIDLLEYALDAAPNLPAAYSLDN